MIDEEISFKGDLWCCYICWLVWIFGVIFVTQVDVSAGASVSISYLELIYSGIVFSIYEELLQIPFK